MHKGPVISCALPRYGACDYIVFLLLAASIIIMFIICIKKEKPVVTHTHTQHRNKLLIYMITHTNTFTHSGN